MKMELAALKQRMQDETEIASLKQENEELKKMIEELKHQKNEKVSDIFVTNLNFFEIDLYCSLHAF